MSAILASALISCDSIFNFVMEREESASETESKNNSESNTESATLDGDSSDESSKTETSSDKITDESESTDKSEVTTTESSTVSESETTESTTDKAPDESEETTTTSPETERFDYFSADMSEYITIDEGVYKNFATSLPAYLDGSDAAVQAYIQLLLEEYPTQTNKIVDKAIENGDTVALYYEGWLDGEKFSGGSNMDDADPYMLEIGSGTFIPGFEEALIGLVPNQNSRDNLYDLHISFPDSYHQASLAGKAVVFKVYVEYIAEYAPAEYTEEFITQTLGYATNAADVKADFEKYLKDEHLPQMRENQLTNEIWEKITDEAVVKEYPQSELDYFAKAYEDQYMGYYNNYYYYMFSSYEAFMDAYFGENWEAYFEEQCKTDVKQNLIFNYIAQKENMVITDADYQAAIQYYIDYYAEQGYTVTASQIESVIGERMIKEQALWDKVNEFIVANCEITYE